jgi:hypothetical protein
MNDELWRMDKKASDQPRPDLGMVGKGDWNQPVCGQSLENRNDTKDSQLSDDLRSDCEVAKPASQSSHPRWGFLYWGLY